MTMIYQENSALRAMIVDHNRLYRAGLKLMLESAKVNVVAEGDDLEALVSAAQDTGGRDILPMKMPPPLAAAETLQNAREAFPATKVAVGADVQPSPNREGNGSGRERVRGGGGASV